MSAIEDFMRARAMRASPDYAKYMMQTDADRATADRSHPSSVAQAYSAIQQFMADKQRTDKAMHEFQTNQSFRAPQSLESFEANKPQYRQPSPLEQWKTRLEAMMQSGNPVLQKQALGELQAQSQEEVKPATSNQSDAIKQYEYALGQGYKGSFEQWKLANKATTTIDMGNKYLSREDSLHLLGPDGKPLKRIPTALTYEEAARRGYTFGNKATAEEAKSEGSTAASLEMLTRLEQLVSSGQADISGMEGIITDFRSQSGVSNAAADYLLNVFQQPKKAADIEAHSLSVALGNQLLQAFRGAAVGPAEKEDFIKQLPTAGQPKAVFEENIRLTRRNLDIINKTKREMRGSAKEDAPQEPITWQADGYEYRKNPDGKIQRRKL